MDKLSEYLASKGLTQGAFAALCNVSPSTITRVIRGDVNVTADLARTINAVTDGKITPNDLILKDVGGNSMQATTSSPTNRAQTS